MDKANVTTYLLVIFCFTQSAFAFSSEERLKQFQVETFQKSPAEFCKKNSLLRFLNSKKPHPTIRDGATIEEIEKITDQEIPNNFNEWQRSLIPTASSLNATIDLTLSKYRLGFLNLDNAEKHLNDIQNLPTNDDLKNASKTLDLLSSYPAWKQNSIISYLGISYICSDVNDSGSGSIDCRKGAQFIKDNMTPKTSSAGEYTALFAWKRLFADQKYQEGIRLAGLKVIERLNHKSSNDGNIYEDLVASFAKSGLPSRDAIAATLDSLMIISNGGPNIWQRLTGVFWKNPKNTSVVALSIIASGLTKLDYERSKNGLALYSYPKGIKVSCLYQKPYHFWMAAGLSYQLTHYEGLDTESTINAGFAAQKAYQINRVNSGGNVGGSIGAILNKEAFDPVHQIIRLDLAFAAAGAIFGARLEHYPNTVLDIDAGIKALLYASSIEAPKKFEGDGILTKLAAFNLWEKIFSPNAVLTEYQKSLK